MSITNPEKTVVPSVISCDGKAKVTISFDAEPSLVTSPADIVLIMDRSSSLSDADMQAAKKGAKQFIQVVAKASGDDSGQTIQNGSRIAVVSFSNQATADLPLTTSVAQLETALDDLKISGETNHEAAFIMANTMFEPESDNRRIMLMFTDGISTLGNAGPVAETLKQEDVEIYGIGLTNNSQAIKSLETWSSLPTESHVGYTNDPQKLEEIFQQIARATVETQTVNAVVREVLNPDFKILSAEKPSHGVAIIKANNKLEWHMDHIQVKKKEKFSLSFEIMHIGSEGGMKQVNQMIEYEDHKGTSLAFPNPCVEVKCGEPKVYPEPCPQPDEFTIESCEDYKPVELQEVQLHSLGRIVQVNAVIKNVCPDKRVAVAIILTETNAEGEEHARGMKTMVLPAQGGYECQDLHMKCIPFVVPEELDETGEANSLCNERTFRARVIANYIDTDYVCCDNQTVIL